MSDKFYDFSASSKSDSCRRLLPWQVMRFGLDNSREREVDIRISQFVPQFWLNIPRPVTLISWLVPKLSVTARSDGLSALAGLRNLRSWVQPATTFAQVASDPSWSHRAQIQIDSSPPSCDLKLRLLVAVGHCDFY